MPSMLYAFGDYILDTARRELQRQGCPVPLEPKGYQVLLYLVQHRERLVTKAELLEHMWPEVYVIDTTVSRCLTLVRKAVGDSGTAQRIIKTLHGQGYRFVATVVVQAETTPEALPTTASAPLRPETVESWYCGTCQQPNPVTAQCCTTCGAALATTCPHCGQQATLSMPFCPQCGQRLTLPATAASGPEPSAPATPAVGSREPLASSATLPLPEGERKLVTVLSGSVSPALSLLAGIDLEDQQLLVERLEALVREAMQPYAGTLEYLGSDRFRVVFGVPQAHEEHAHQALLTALAIQQQWASWCRGVSIAPATPVVLGLGLHTGHVVLSPAGDAPASPPTLVGDVLPLADHLAQHAGAGTLLVSAATAHLLRAAVRLEAAPSVPVPGQAAPLGAYRVTDGLGGPALGTGWEARRRSPFVGRQGEVAALHTHLTHT